MTAELILSWGVSSWAWILVEFATCQINKGTETNKQEPERERLLIKSLKTRQEEKLEGKHLSNSPTCPPAKFILRSSSNDKTEYYKSLYVHQPTHASLRDRKWQLTETVQELEEMRMVNENWNWECDQTSSALVWLRVIPINTKKQKLSFLVQQHIQPLGRKAHGGIRKIQ